MQAPLSNERRSNKHWVKIDEMSMTTTLSAFFLVLANFALSVGASQEKGPRTTNDIHYRMSSVGDTQIRFPRLTAYKEPSKRADRRTLERIRMSCATR
jgi:hypothetical protein